MTDQHQQKVERRVTEAAETALRAQRNVSAIDVLIGLRWLHPSHVDVWRQGRVDSLDELIQVGPDKLTAAMVCLHRWADDRALVASETAYVARTRDRRPLRFTAGGDPDVERAYRTHWVSPQLSAAQRQRMTERQSRPPDLVVVSALKPWTCAGCSDTMRGLLIMEDDAPLCLECADLDHLVFLGAGDATLTRRAKKASRLSAVVVRFSRARKRHERQGVLVEEQALAQAEASCLADEEARRRRRERAEAAREVEDERFHADFAEAISRLFPGCPTERAVEIARHAGARRSGRVGRTAAGRALDEGAVTAAVVASVRHRDTDYDDLLMSGVAREDARQRVGDDLDRVLAEWRRSEAPSTR